MRYVDVHCHLDDTFFKDDLDDVIKRTKESNVLAIPAGVNPETNRFLLELKKKYPETIFPTLGMYPPDALAEEEGRLPKDFDIDSEIEFIYKNKKSIVGIGEVGMDNKNGKDLDMQEKIFRKMVELAIKMDKPVVIHSRKAEKRVIEIMEEYNYRKVVMHCFGGNHKLVQRIRDNKYWSFSIPTSIVRDQHFQKLVKETPIHLLLTETDSPFLSPFREQRNEPKNVMETIKVISEIKRLPMVDTANILYRNAVKLFKIR